MCLETFLIAQSQRNHLVCTSVSEPSSFRQWHEISPSHGSPKSQWEETVSSAWTQITLNRMANTSQWASSYAPLVGTHTRTHARTLSFSLNQLSRWFWHSVRLCSCKQRSGANGLLFCQEQKTEQKRLPTTPEHRHRQVTTVEPFTLATSCLRSGFFQL